MERQAQQELLRMARATLSEFLATGEVPSLHPSCPGLLDHAGAFVTLHESDGALRGCIGTQSLAQPLVRTVQDMAVAAATRDPRFAPVTSEELDALVIEISVLGGHERVTSTDEIKIGTHGLTISLDGRHGLLLPQVAIEAGWSTEQLLRNLCSKAGLANHDWRNPRAIVEKFTAEVFGETTRSERPH